MTPRAGAAGVLRCLGLAVELVGSEQAAVGVARPEVLELHDAADLGLESVAYAIEQVVDGGVVRRFPGAAAGQVHAVDGSEEGGKCLLVGHSVGPVRE